MNRAGPIHECGTWLLIGLGSKTVLWESYARCWAVVWSSVGSERQMGLGFTRTELGVSLSESPVLKHTASSPF